MQLEASGARRPGYSPTTARPRAGALARLLCTGIVALTWAGFASAQTTLYWDTNGATSGAGGSPAGIWSSNGSYKNWSTSPTGTGSTLKWTDHSLAVFSAGGSSSSAYTVTVSDTVRVTGILIQSGTPTFNGGTIQLSGSNPAVTVNSGLSSTINSSVAGNWTGLVKLGTGTAILAGDNTYTGGTTIGAGTLIAAHNAALGAAGWSNAVTSGATLGLQGGISLDQHAVALSGAGANGTGALRNVSGNNSLSAYTTISGATTLQSHSGTLTHTGTITMGSSAVTVNGAGHVVLSGSVQDSSTAASLTYAGNGTLTLSGTASNTFGGTLNINSGTVVAAKSGGAVATNGGAINIGDGVGASSSAVLRLDADQQLATYTALLKINSDGKLVLNNVSQRIDKIAGTGLIDLAKSGVLVVGANSGSSVFSGSITGTGTLEKTGFGSLTFESGFTFGGTLKLSGGALSLDGVNVSVGTLHITGDTVLDFSSAAAATLRAANLLIDAGVTLTITGWTSGMDYLFAQNWHGATFDSRGGTTTSQVVFSGFSGGETSWQGFDRQITPVPEPRTYGAILLGLAAACYVIHRRRRTVHSRCC